jgi:hypothetical protein
MVDPINLGAAESLDNGTHISAIFGAELSRCCLAHQCFQGRVQGAHGIRQRRRHGIMRPFDLML